ncbi:ribonuclease inhibitor-like [Asterias amurensis]|uniref:ribonuclease inhibitor-like n=1 Tax=Asterias amurensis TaxID=7602 RepID=UPI003AB58C50
MPFPFRSLLLPMLVFSIVAAAGSVTKLGLSDNDLHGIKGDHITPISSLKELHLNACGIQSDDIGSVFSIVAAAGSVTTLFLNDNDLHGIKGDHITPVSSLKELHLNACGLQSDDIGPVFSIVAAAGSVTTLFLKDNDLHCIKGDQITPVSTLKELHLYACGVKSDDIGPVFSIVGAAGSVLKLKLKDNDLHGIEGDHITPVSSLKKLLLCACGIQSDDIGSVFSIVSAAGSVMRLVLQDNDLHGIKADQITRVSSLEELLLVKCGIQSDDIGSVFSIVSAAGSVMRLALKENDLHGIKADQITRVSSLKELILAECGIQSNDIGSVFSIVAAAGSVMRLVLQDNDLHGVKADRITPVSSLTVLYLYACGLQRDDIGPVFSVVGAAGSVLKLNLKDNDLHGIEGDHITPVSPLKELLLCACGSIKRVWLKGNNLRGMRGNQITAVSSLKFLSLTDCGLQTDECRALAMSLESFFQVNRPGHTQTQGSELNALMGKTLCPNQFRPIELPG